MSNQAKFSGLNSSSVSLTTYSDIGKKKKKYSFRGFKSSFYMSYTWMT